VQACFLELAGKERLLVQCIWNARRLSHKRYRLCEGDALLGTHCAFTKGNGGNMPFACGPQAQNKAESAGWQPGLIGVRHYGRIKQRR